MLVIAFALGVVIFLLVTNEPKKRPADSKADPEQVRRRTFKRAQRRMWVVGVLSLLLGISLFKTPLIGPVVDVGSEKSAQLLTVVHTDGQAGQDAPPEEPPTTGAKRREPGGGAPVVGATRAPAPPR